MIKWSFRLCKDAKKFWLFFLTMLVLHILLTGVQLIQPLLLSNIIDNGISKSNISVMFKNGIIAIFLILLVFCLRIIIQKIITKVNCIVGMNVRKKMLVKAEVLPGSTALEFDNGKLLSLYLNDVIIFEQLMSSVYISILNEALSIITVLIIMSTINYTLMLVCIIAFFVFFCLQKIMSKVLSKKIELQKDNCDNLIGKLQERINFFYPILLCGLNKLFWGKFTDSQSDYYNSEAKVRVTGAVFGDIMSTANALCNILVFIVGGYYVINGSFTLGLLTAFSMYVSRLLSPLSNISRYSMNYQEAKISMQRIKEYLEKDEIYQDVATEVSIRSDINIKNLSFSYAIENALSNVSMFIPAEKITAVVGKSGSGKSTLVNLLFRFWDNYTGKIEISGQDIRDIDISKLRSMVAVIGQDTFLINATVRENLTCGTHISDSRIFDILDLLNMKQVVNDLPSGMDTVISSTGFHLSGGQNQRIALARALLMDKKILVFDEATSALDRLTEHEILGKIKPLLSGKTVLIITHRLNTISDSNYIFFLDKGIVIESGTHDELISLNGHYAQQIRINTEADK